MTHGEGAARSEGKVVSINFYQASKLPSPLAEIAKQQGFSLKDGVVAVKTIVGSPPTYQFERVGVSPKEIKAYQGKLAHADGTDINDALKRAFAENK